MEAYFATIFEDVRHERLFILLLLLTGSDILKHSNFTDDGIKIIKTLALEELHRQRIEDIERAYGNGSVRETIF